MSCVKIGYAAHIQANTHCLRIYFRGMSSSVKPAGFEAPMRSIEMLIVMSLHIGRNSRRVRVLSNATGLMGYTKPVVLSDIF